MQWDVDFWQVGIFDHAFSGYLSKSHTVILYNYLASHLGTLYMKNSEENKFFYMPSCALFGLVLCCTVSSDFPQVLLVFWHRNRNYPSEKTTMQCEQMYAKTYIVSLLLSIKGFKKNIGKKSTLLQCLTCNNQVWLLMATVVQRLDNSEWKHMKHIFWTADEKSNRRKIRTVSRQLKKLRKESL